MAVSSSSGSDSSSDRSLAFRYPRRAESWRLRTRTLTLGRLPLLMGIVNVTPDSFSDGGRFFATDEAIERAVQLVEDGVDLIDIGGESTRPYSEPVTVDDELARVLPVVRELCRQVPVPISIDTSKAAVAEAALEAGAEIINDVTALAGDPRMLEVAQASGAGVCAMHMQGTPQTMQDDPQYGDVIAEILEYLRQRRETLLAAGIERERICLDPGIGFGKTHQHNLTLAAHCGEFHELGQPLLVGHSRKGFIGKVLQERNIDRAAAEDDSHETTARDAGSLGVALSLAAQGVQVLRVHEVRRLRQALQLFAATGGIDGQEVVLP